MNAVIRRFWGLCLALGLSLSANAATGNVTTIAGYLAGYQNGSNDVSQFNKPYGLAVDLAGRVVVADYGNNAIRLIVPTTQQVTTFKRNDGYLSGPVAVAVDADGRIFVVNKNNGTVTLYTSTGIATNIVSSGLFAPTAIALDRVNGSGTFYVTDGAVVNRYNSDGSLNKQFPVGDGNTQLSGIVVPGSAIIVSDSGNNVLWQIPTTTTNNTATVFAGNFTAGFADGTSTNAMFNRPAQLAITTNGVVIVADQKNHRVRAVNNVGSVTTLFGASPTDWSGFFPGWVDGSVNQVQSHDPFGVAVANDGTLYDSEIYYHIVRMATGITYPTNVTSGGTSPGGNTNLPPTGNLMTLGFASGRGSTAFIGTPGQVFAAPVTLTIEPGTSIYGMQLNLSVENSLSANAATGLGSAGLSFLSGLFKPNPIEPDTFLRIDPKFFMRTAIVVETQTNFVNGSPIISLEKREIGVFRDLVFTNTAGNLIAVGWLEYKGMTNLYPTTSQDLITFSAIHSYRFEKSGGKIMVGTLTFKVPMDAVDKQYVVKVGRPSANGDGSEKDVPIAAPDDPDGPVSAVRPLRIGKIGYIVGDVLPFRWFNAGDFGDGSILNNDLDQVQLPIAYGYNFPPPGTDFFDAMDSCCVTFDDVDMSAPGFESTWRTNPDAVLNSIGKGDGIINLADFYVSFRRSLDPSLSNVVRFWEGGQRKALPTNNTFRGVAGDTSTQLATVTKKKDSGYNAARAQEPVTARYSVKSVYGQPGQIANVPIQLDITGPLTARSFHFRVVVTGLDGLSVVSEPVTFTPAASLGAAWKSSTTTNSYEGIWFELPGGYPAGSYQIGTVEVRVPADANADTLFGVKLEAAEASTAITVFPTTTQNGIIVMPNRAAAPWTDEIPDAWRIQYFGSLMNILSAPDADADGDGFTTLQEYRAGTNPNDVNSVLAVNSKAGVSSIVLSWPTIIGKTYKLESSASLTNPTWTVVEQGIAGNGGSVQRTRTLDSDARFFRVTAE